MNWEELKAKTAAKAETFPPVASPEDQAEQDEYARLRVAPTVEWHRVHFHSLQEPLGEVIAQAIEQFRDSGLHGYPTDAEDAPWIQAMDFTGESPGFQAWLAILTKIADGFRAVPVMDDYSYDDATREAATTAFNEGMDLFKTYYLHLWD